MKRIKGKIVATIMSMSLALGVMGFAVFAAATQSFSVNNSINFGTDNVKATVVATVSGTNNS